eukprot:6175531-Pleurochrysis_carterae.AAC.1
MPAKKMTLLALTGLLKVAMAHVRLNWPPAQHPSDFLDNIRTPDPCGLGEPNENTVIRGGSSIVVEWHLGYAHYGGHELQIINRSSSVDENGECFYPVLAQLTNFTANELQDASTHSMEVEIPTGLGCGADSQCALRLIRSASEWGSTAAPYNFLCAALPRTSSCMGFFSVLCAADLVLSIQLQTYVAKLCLRSLLFCAVTSSLDTHPSAVPLS